MLKRLHTMLLTAIATGSFAQTTESPLSLLLPGDSNETQATSAINNESQFWNTNTAEETVVYKQTKKKSRKNSNVVLSDSDSGQIGKAEPQLKKIVLLWDISASCSGRQIKREMTILGAYLKKHQNVLLTVALFSARLYNITSLHIVEGKTDELQAFLTTPPADEDVQSGRLNISEFAAEAFILSSDGFAAASLINDKPVCSPVNVIQSSITANSGSMKSLAEKTGGVYMNLNAMSNDMAVSLLTDEMHTDIQTALNFVK